MKYTLKDLWTLACKHDGIDPKSSFVVWTKGNPWAKKYNTLARFKFASIAQGAHYKRTQ